MLVLCVEFLIASEASFLVCSMHGFSISGRTSCRKCSKCFYVYLNIRSKRIPLCNYKRATRKRNRLNDLSYKSAAAYVEQDFARPMLASYYRAGSRGGSGGSNPPFSATCLLFLKLM